MSQHLSPLAFRSRVLLLAFALSVGACSSAPKQELDPVDELPQIQRINVKAERIQLSVSLDGSMDDSALPEGLMASSIGRRTEGEESDRQVDRLLTAFIVALGQTGHFTVVQDSEADFHFALALRSVETEAESDLSTIDSMKFKFMGLALKTKARLAGVLYDSDGEQIGAILEQRGSYERPGGVEYDDEEDEFLNLLGMGSYFSKTAPPGPANAIQKAIVKLIADLADVTALNTPSDSGQE